MARERVGISDIARETGLSKATIDRVLNGRSGVRAETVARVHEAVQKLSYSASALDSLKKKESKKVEILLSEGTNPFFEQIRMAFEAKIAEMSHTHASFSIKAFDPYDPNTLVECLRGVDDDTNVVITIGVDTPEANLAIDDLVANGVTVVVVISDAPQSKRSAYVGQDNAAAGKTAARLMIGALPPEPCSVAVLIGHLHHRHLVDRQSGFLQVIGMERPDVNVLTAKPYGTKTQTSSEIVEELARQGSTLKGVYIGGGGQPYLVDELIAQKNIDPVIIGHEATTVTKRQIVSGAFRFVIAHDLRQVTTWACEAALSPSSRPSWNTSINIYVKDNFPELQ